MKIHESRFVAILQQNDKSDVICSDSSTPPISSIPLISYVPFSPKSFEVRKRINYLKKDEITKMIGCNLCGYFTSDEKDLENHGKTHSVNTSLERISIQVGNISSGDISSGDISPGKIPEEVEVVDNTS